MKLSKHFGRRDAVPYICRFFDGRAHRPSPTFVGVFGAMWASYLTFRGFVVIQSLHHLAVVPLPLGKGGFFMRRFLIPYTTLRWFPFNKGGLFYIKFAVMDYVLVLLILVSAVKHKYSKNSFCTFVQMRDIKIPQSPIGESSI